MIFAAALWSCGESPPAGAAGHEAGRTGILTLEMSIGAAESADYAFDRVQVLLPARDGTLWVTDGQIGSTSNIRQYDADGRLIRHIGRAGEGPGEFRAPCGMAQLPDGRVVVSDLSLQSRLNVYLPDGTIDTVLTLANPHHGQGCGIDSDTSGVLWMPFNTSVLPRSRMPPGPAPPVRYGYVRLRDDGSVIDSVTPPEGRHKSAERASISVTSTLPGGGTRVRGINVPFQPSNIGGWSPHGYFASGISSIYEIDLHIPPSRAGDAAPLWQPGDSLITISKSASPTEVGSQERAYHRDRIRREVEAENGIPSGPIPEIPTTRQLLNGVYFGLDGRLWALVSVPSQRVLERVPPGSAAAVRWREERTFDVFEPRGAFIGRVVVPDCAFGLRMRGDQIWCVQTNELGVQTIHRYRVTWP